MNPHEQDIDIISRKLKDGAVKHNLCDALFSEIDDINKNLAIPLDVRQERPFRVVIETVVTLERCPSVGCGGNYRSPEQWILDQLKNAVTMAVDGASFAGTSQVRIVDIQEVK